MCPQTLPDFFKKELESFQGFFFGIFLRNFLSHHSQKVTKVHLSCPFFINFTYHCLHLFFLEFKAQCLHCHLKFLNINNLSSITIKEIKSFPNFLCLCLSKLWLRTHSFLWAIDAMFAVLKLEAIASTLLWPLSR